MSVEKDFPRPPGGKLICESGQTAVIRIRAGEITARCYSAPGGMKVTSGDGFSNTFKNWALELVTGDHRQRRQVLTSTDRAILNAGEYEFLDGDVPVRVEFTLPARRRGSSMPRSS